MSLEAQAYKLDAALWVEDLGLLQDKQGHSCLLDDNQRKIFNPQYKRLIINCHRQWGKSTISSLLCFHRALFFPKSLCLLVAPSLRQSSENFRKISDALETVTPKPELEEDTKLTLKFTNGSRIISLPGSQKTVRGFTAPDLVIIDESAQAEDELFGALLPMLSSNIEGRLILCSTPWGKRGFFYKIWTDDTERWLKIKVIASENPRIRSETLEEARQSPNGVLWFKQEYCGEFIEANNAVFSFGDVQAALSDSVEPLEV